MGDRGRWFESTQAYQSALQRVRFNRPVAQWLEHGKVVLAILVAHLFSTELSKGKKAL